MRARWQAILLAVFVTLVGSTAFAQDPASASMQPSNQTMTSPSSPDCGNANGGYVEMESAPVPGSWEDTALGRFARSIARDTKRNACWPQPFVCPDRQSVREPFVRMVAKGWVRQNTLGEHHFEAETGKLTYAGILRVRKILLEGPPQHRTIYVHRALNPSETSARVDAVQQLAAETVRTGDLPPVLETNLPAPGWPAEQVDAVGRRYRDSIPNPRLPSATESGSSDSGSGGSQ